MKQMPALETPLTAFPQPNFANIPPLKPRKKNEKQTLAVSLVTPEFSHTLTHKPIHTRKEVRRKLSDS